MIAFLLIGLFLLTAFDARLLRSQDEALYDKIFNAIPEKWGFFGAFLFIFALPIYLYRRSKFIKEQKVSLQGFGENPDAARIVFASDASGIFIAWFCIVLFASVIFHVALEAFVPGNFDLGELVIMSVFSSVVMVFLIYRITRNYPQGFLASVGLKNEFGKGSLFRVVFMPLLLGISFAALSASVMAKRASMPDTPMNDMLLSAGSPTVIFIFLGAAVLLAPFFEEIMFRGYFFDVIRRYKGENTAVFLITGSFALLHVEQYWGDWMAIVMVAFVGFVLTALRVWSGTTIASIVMHYSYNLCIAVVPVIMLSFTNPAMFEYSMKYGQLSFEKKEVLLRQSIEEHPEYMDAYNDLAWLYSQEDERLEESLELISKALRNAPKSGPYLDTKAEILYRMGRTDEAIAIQMQLVEDHPANSIYQQHLRKFQKGVGIEPGQALR